MAGKFDIATFLKDQKNYFEEALKYWEQIVDAKLPACDDYDECDDFGTLEWHRESKIVLNLSKGMEWIIITGPDSKVYTFEAMSETKECIEQLQSLLDN